jgi:hypothetical protein
VEALRSLLQVAPGLGPEGRPRFGAALFHCGPFDKEVAESRRWITNSACLSSRRRKPGVPPNLVRLILSAGYPFRDPLACLRFLMMR